MRQKTHYNWNNSFVKCGEDSFCAYVNNKCLNPNHMSVRQYERHFKSKASLSTTGRFKKLLHHYLPGDNIIESIIEQTRFFKKSETELVVKLWEENWMDGSWNEAISKADEILAERDYHALVKIILNYVRLFVHNEAKYATQDYVKAVMLQDYINEEFTQKHYETLTRPWLAAKRGAQAHKWSYKNRNLNIETVEITDTLKSVAADLNTQQEINNLAEYSDPEFIQETQINNNEEFSVVDKTPYYWNQEKLTPQEDSHIPVKVETENIDSFDYEEARSEVLISGYEEISTVETTQTRFIDYTQDYSELPELLKTSSAVQNIITDIDSETPPRQVTDNSISEKVKNSLQTISSNGNKVVKNVKNYLGYNISDEYYEEKVDLQESSNPFHENFYEETISNSVEESWEENINETVTYNEENQSDVSQDNVEAKISQMPEHLQDFMKTIYLK